MTAPEANGSVAGGLAPWGGVFTSEGAAPLPPNSSREGPWVLPTFSAAAQARVALTLLLSLVATACNAAVLWAGVGGCRARRSHARALLLHLAGADLLVALVVMPLDAAWNITLQWRAGDAACRLLMFLKLLAMYASAFITAIISLDRQAAILHPLAIAQAWRRNQVLLQAAWLLSACLSTPQVSGGREAPGQDSLGRGFCEGGRDLGGCALRSAGGHRHVLGPSLLHPAPSLPGLQLFLFRTMTVHSPQSFTQCSTQGSFAQPWHETAYNMFTFLGLFLLPLLVMVACYARILGEISRRTGSSHSGELRGGGGAEAELSLVSGGRQ